MKIRKIGHCCLVIEINDKKIMTDPGAYTSEQIDERNVDFILITHEHSDHFHLESLKLVLKNNPNAKVITNSGVGALLKKEKIEYILLEDKQAKDFGGVLIEGFGLEHAEVYKSVIPVKNTGYFVNNELFYPGDALTNPQKPVSVLALPVAGPWLKLSEAIDYAKNLKPKVCFPVHDGMLKHLGSTHNLPQKELKAIDIEFIILDEKFYEL